MPFYVKNLPAWERAVRLLAAAAMSLCAARFWGTPVGYAWGSAAAVIASTSLVGFCPMCALAGRRIASRRRAASEAAARRPD